MRVRGLTLSGQWRPDEVRELIQALGPLPPRWIEHNSCLKSIIRRPILVDAPPEAPGHSKYDPSTAAIVVFDKGVYHGGKIDSEQFRRSVYHELAHTLLRQHPELLDRWQSATDGDDFVDDYAKTGPEEDFADTFSEFLIHGDKTRRRVPQKSAFLSQLLEQAHQQEKRAMAFLDGFADEMIKTARGGILSLLRRGASKAPKGRRARRAVAGRTPGKMSVGKGILLAGGGSAGGVALGSSRGRKKGYEEGTGDVMDVANRARILGRREGVLAYHRALMQHQAKRG